MDVDEYASTYINYVSAFANGAFDATKVSAAISGYKVLLFDDATMENFAFINAVSSLYRYVQPRNAIAKSYTN
jgi:hypothetical protein